MENPNYNDLKNNVLDNNSHWMTMQPYCFWNFFKIRTSRNFCAVAIEF